MGSAEHNKHKFKAKQNAEGNNNTGNGLSTNQQDNAPVRDPWLAIPKGYGADETNNIKYCIPDVLLAKRCE